MGYTVLIQIFKIENLELIESIIKKLNIEKTIEEVHKNETEFNCILDFETFTGFTMKISDRLIFTLEKPQFTEKNLNKIELIFLKILKTFSNKNIKISDGEGIEINETFSAGTILKIKEILAKK